MSLLSEIRIFDKYVLLLISRRVYAINYSDNNLVHLYSLAIDSVIVARA